MRFRKLRIAWSVVWGLACVLLIALWVRSYWYWDDVTIASIPPCAYGIGIIVDAWRDVSYVERIRFVTGFARWRIS